MTQDRIVNWEELPPQIREQWHQRATGLTLPPLSFVGNDNNASPKDRLAAINRDPALCAKILAVANSASQGRSNPIVSVERAVVHLGENMLQIIMSAYHMETVIGRFPAFSREHFNFVRNWSAFSSITAFHFASNAGLENREIISTATLISRLGSLVLGLTWPSPEKSYYEISDENQRYYYEMEKWGVSTPVLGQQIAMHWGLPEPLPTLIQRQEFPLFTKLTESDQDKSTLIMCVSSAISAAYMLNPESDPVEALYEGHYFQLKQNLDLSGYEDALRTTWDSKVLDREIQSIRASG